jgi:hypothetical protein
LNVEVAKYFCFEFVVVEDVLKFEVLGVDHFLLLREVQIFGRHAILELHLGCFGQETVMLGSQSIDVGSQVIAACSLLLGLFFQRLNFCLEEPVALLKVG